MFAHTFLGSWTSHTCKWKSVMLYPALVLKLLLPAFFSLCNLLSCYSTGMFDKSSHWFSWYINYAPTFFKYTQTVRLLWLIHDAHHPVHKQWVVIVAHTWRTPSCVPKILWTTMFYVGNKSLRLLLMSYSGMQVRLPVQKQPA